MHQSQTYELAASRHVSATIRGIVSALLLVAVPMLSGCGLFKKDEGKKNSGPGSSSYQEPGCQAGTVDCAGSCVAPLSDPANCGVCGSVCAAGQYCEGGACLAFCPSGETDCGGTCQLTVSDAGNCGGCGLSCTPGLFCDSGVCSATCSGTLCTDALGAQACAHLQANNDHCGACGNACGLGQECQNGVCAEACPPGRAACGAGCVDVRSNVQNCGGCGVACAPGQACVEGQCGGAQPICTGGACSCTAGELDCNGACVNTQSNNFHCGACGVECLAGQQCTAGLCQCLSGTTLCDGACKDTLSDDSNCGGCGTVCSGGTHCEAGMCQCAVGQELCDGMCVDPGSDSQNCGGCGNVCEGYEACFDGVCKYEGDQCGGGARGVDLTRVSMYQAVELDLFADGEMVPAEERTVDVIQGRAAMVRVFVEPGAGFVARELSARLFVENDDEDIQIYHHKKSVSGPSSQSNLESTFQIDVPAEAIGESTKYWVELVECSEAEGEAGGVRVPREPGENGEFSARETGIIKIVFVPITHDGRTPDVSESVIQRYADEVKRLYPTTDVEWSLHDPITSDQSGGDIDLGGTLDLVTYQRGLDGVADDVYYYGMIDPTSSFESYCNFSCTTGVGWVLDVEAPWTADNRAAVGVGFGTFGAETFAHELGHNHGREHAPCNVNGEPNYPYAGGSIGVWGYDLMEGELKDPMRFADFMGYCQDNWVSDYSYNAYTARIASLNGVSDGLQSFSFAGAPSIWYRMIVTEGDMHWMAPVERYGKPRPYGDVGYVYDSAGNVIETVTVFRVLMSHNDGYMLYVPEPQAGWHSVGAAGGPALAY